MDPFVQDLAVAALTEAASAAVRRFTARRARPDRELQDKLAEGLAQHLRYVNAVASRVQIFGMTAPEDTARSTVALDMRDLPRRFRGGHAAGAQLREADLLADGGNVAVLGDPGAGKTTTIKRLAQRMLTEPPATDQDIWAFPVLLLCREREWVESSLDEQLANMLRVPTALPDSMDASVGRRDLAYALLDEGPAILFIDGLDEMPVRERLRLERDIERFADRASLARVIVSCRSGDYRHLDGFSLVELCPLTDRQIDVVADRALQDSGPFLRALRDSPLADLASRPLFLAQLLVVYRNSGGAIPEQPVSLYRMMIRLLLQDWDEQRRIARASQYARFQVDDKLEFLSALSYELTVEGKALRFRNDDLVDAYARIAPRFDLPANEARRVARELESHTGIIVESGTSFEFSHLSLQEYLCAYYIVREPFDDHVARYLHEYPAPVAVAVALSSDPSRWIANVVLRSGVLDEPDQVRSFVYRLGKERPRFTHSPDLGFAVVKLMAKAGAGSAGHFEELATSDAVRSSVTEALASYRQTPDGTSTRLVAEAGSRSASRMSAGRVDRRLLELMTT
jgi:NACHT domain